MTVTVDMFQAQLDDARERGEADALAETKATERLREFEADFTPRFVCRAVLEAVTAGTPMNYRGTKSIVGPPSSVWPAIGRGHQVLWASHAQTLAPLLERDIERTAKYQRFHRSISLVQLAAEGRTVYDEGTRMGPVCMTDDPRLTAIDEIADLASTPVVELPRGDLRVFRVLDVCAGAGVWASEVRRIAALLGVRVHITAVEYREEERVWLLRHADEVIIGDWHEALGMVLDEQGRWVFGPDGPREYDLIVGNPAFSHARAPVRPEWEQAAWDAATATVKEAKRRAKEGLDALPALEYANARKEIARLQAKHKDLTQAAVAEGKLEELAKYDPEGSMPALCLRSAPAVVLYLTQQCWTKTASGWLVRRICPPAVAHDIPGSVAHRGPGVGMDSIPYTGFMWTRGHKGATATNMLEPIESRSWKVRPGTETDEWLTEQGIPFLEDA